MLLTSQVVGWISSIIQTWSSNGCPKSKPNPTAVHPHRRSRTWRLSSWQPWERDLIPMSYTQNLKKHETRMNMCFFSEKGHQFLPNREFRCPMLILQSSNAFPWLRAGTGTAHFTFWIGSTDTLSDTETWPGWHGAPWGTRFSEVSFEMYGSLEDFGKMWYNDGKIWRNHEKSTKLWNIYYAIQINLIFCFWNWEALNGTRRLFYRDF